MGIHLYNKEYSMDMGYISFYQLRCVVAQQFGKEFLIAYQDLYKNKLGALDSLQEMINSFFINGILDAADNDALDFLFLSDCKGKVSYNGCKKLYKLVKNYNDDRQFGYVYSNNTFNYFKEMLHNCATKKRNLYWS